VVERLVSQAAWARLRPWQQRLLRLIVAAMLVGFLLLILGLVGFVGITSSSPLWLQIIVYSALFAGMMLLGLCVIGSTLLRL
jgi:zinc transporter ZupT